MPPNGRIIGLEKHPRRMKCAHEAMIFKRLYVKMRGSKGRQGGMPPRAARLQHHHGLLGQDRAMLFQEVAQGAGWQEAT